MIEVLPLIRARRVSRRLFLRDLGRGALAVAVVGTGLVACDDDDDAGEATGTPTKEPTATGTASATTPPAATTTPTPTESSGEDPTSTSTPGAATAGGSEPEAGAVEWARVNLGFVSAYVLVRNGEAAIVDTGVEGSATDIEAALTASGVAWGDVGHVIVTHRHGDHAGSLDAVMAAAASAQAYAGAGDIASISAPRPIEAVGDGDRVFGLEIVETPGHTPGHIAAWDPAGGLLLAGDALIGTDGSVGGPDPGFASDLDLAHESVVKLAGLEFETVLFGHGEPLLSGGATAVAALAARL